MTPEARTHSVKERARHLRFDTVGVTALAPPPHAQALERWIAAGMAGTMSYMARQIDHRRDPATIVPGATHAVLVSKNYFRPDRPLPPGKGRVAKYARGRDYHVALRPALERLAEHVHALGGGDAVARAYLDAGPVPERELAQMAGLGWIGKNTMLLDPRRGSYLFLAAVLTNVELAVDEPFEADRCGTCRRCLDACPTNAFPEARVLDARRCISYLTIEHRGPIDRELQARIGEWLFGCDICQQVCPWNIRFAHEPKDDVLDQREKLEALDLRELLSMSDAEFRDRLGWTAMERPGPEGMRRNARAVAANQRTPDSATPDQVTGVGRLERRRKNAQPPR